MNEVDRQALRSCLQTTAEEDELLFNEGKTRGLPEVRRMLSLQGCLSGKPAETSAFFQVVVDNNVDKEIAFGYSRRGWRNINTTFSLLDYYLTHDVSVSEIAKAIDKNSGTIETRFVVMKKFLSKQLSLRGVDTVDVPPPKLSMKTGRNGSKKRRQVNFPVTF